MFLVRPDKLGDRPGAPAPQPKTQEPKVPEPKKPDAAPKVPEPKIPEPTVSISRLAEDELPKFIDLTREQQIILLRTLKSLLDNNKLDNPEDTESDTGIDPRKLAHELKLSMVLDRFSTGSILRAILMNIDTDGEAERELLRLLRMHTPTAYDPYSDPKHDPTVTTFPQDSI